MIISHKHKFIFSKPRKVAGTSVEVSLSKHCGPDDIITVNVASKDIDASEYTDYARNYEGYFNHIKPARIIAKVGQKTWDDYFTFTIVRNPWDMLVSRYFWNKKNATPRSKPWQVFGELVRSPLSLDMYGKLAMSTKRSLLRRDIKEGDTFADFMKKLPHNYSNTAYYFDKAGKPLQDFVIRYEKLDEDYETVCNQIGIPYEPLLQLKTKTRKKRDYREFYTPELRDWVARDFAMEIEHFGYSFDGVVK